MTDISKKQYLLSSCRLEREGMQEYSFGRMYLYFGNDLAVNKCRTSDGKEVLLLGNAFCADQAEKNALEDVESCTEDQLENVTRFWTGRWVVVTSSCLFCDACTLMGAYYINKDGNFYVSSSLALLSNVLGIHSNSSAKEFGLTWHFAPDTILDDVKALICTQRLNLFDDYCEAEFLDWINVSNKKLSTEEKCEKVASMLVNSAKNISAFSKRRIVLALTGGKDSRVTFCALVKSGVPFSTYTAQHQNISSSDRTIPLKLSKRFGIEHKYIKKNKLSTEKFEDYKLFTKGNSNGADAHFYACNQFSQIPSDAVVIRSGLYEAGQTYSRSLCENSLESLYNGLTRYYSDLNENGSQKESFEKWIDYLKNNPIEGIDFRDRLYIEQRAGCWVSAIEQSLDMNDFMSIQIANCKELLSVLLCCNEQERKELSLSYQTMKLLEPEALEYDVNKTHFIDKLIRIRQIAKNPVAKLKNYINKRKKR